MGGLSAVVEKAVLLAEVRDEYVEALRHIVRVDVTKFDCLLTKRWRSAVELWSNRNRIVVVTAALCK